MKPGDPYIINARSYDGRLLKSWDCRLAEASGPAMTFIGKFHSEVRHTDLGIIRRGTVSYEYYWTDRWYNVFRFHEPGGEFRNYYLNINMPPTVSDHALDYVDLDLDVIVWPDASFRVLDEDEFEANSQLMGYSEHVVSKATATLSDLLTKLRESGPESVITPGDTGS